MKANKDAKLKTQCVKCGETLSRPSVYSKTFCPCFGHGMFLCHLFGKVGHRIFF